MNISTSLNAKKRNEIIKFLDEEINVLNSLNLQSFMQKNNKFLLDYSKALFVDLDKNENETLILN